MYSLFIKADNIKGSFYNRVVSFRANNLMVWLFDISFYYEGDFNADEEVSCRKKAGCLTRFLKPSWKLMVAPGKNWNTSDNSPEYSLQVSLFVSNTMRPLWKLEDSLVCCAVKFFRLKNLKKLCFITMIPTNNLTKLASFSIFLLIFC